MSRKKRVFENQKLFGPSVVRRFTNSSGILRNQTLTSMSGSTVVDTSVTGSFRFDAPGSPIKSSQQLPVDFSRFENHTFFSSAVSNINITYEKIINEFPFEGTKSDYDTWLDGLTGFEKHILDRYPSYTGYLTLHGNNESIKVVDKSGVVFPSISKKNNATTVMNPKKNSFFVELDIAIPNTSSPDQFLFHHISTAGVGYAAYLKSSPSTSTAEVNFSIISGSNYTTANAVINKGRFSHLCMQYDASPSGKIAKILSGSKVIGTSNRFNFDSIDTAGSALLIGTGSAFSMAGSTFTPTKTLSGSINNFRMFHSLRTAPEIQRYTKRSLFTDDESNLKLNFRFNEATGSYQNSDITLDHSGQSLHSKISNYRNEMRSARPYSTLCEFEASVYHPTLFPGHPDVISLNNTLLSTGSVYDENNPNLITKLIPAHYLELAKATGYNSYETSLPDSVTGLNSTSDKYAVPGAANISQPQIISALLFMWARTFDELKMMIDHVSELVHIDYDSNTSVADQFLPFLAQYYGFDLPNLFRNADYDQFFSGENVTSVGTNNLSQLQNQIWRRILTNLPEIITSKGTVHSIKSLFRSSGIDPNRMFRFVEYGGGTDFRLGKSRKKITEISTMLDFSGSITYNPSATIDAQGFSSHSPNIISSYLTGSRIETGYPIISGTFVDKATYPPHGISNSRNDGLLTSGSWTVEGIFKFPNKTKNFSPQSLFRLHTTGSSAHQSVVLNVVADPNIDGVKDDPSMTLWCRPGFSASAPLLKLQINSGNIFNGDKWHVSAGRSRNDEVNSFVSSSYFLNLSRQENGEIVEFYTTSSMFLDSLSRGENAFQKRKYLGTEKNSSGSFIVVGNQSIDTSASSHLNASSVPLVARTTMFSGLAGHIRFWSKALTESETREHVRNFSSLGVVNPLKNFGFSHEVTGSFEKLRLDISTDQPSIDASPGGAVTLTDFSQQFKTVSSLGGLSIARGFEPNKKIIKPERFDYSAISYLFDEPSSENKVRIAGMTQGENIHNFDTLPAPIYEIPAASEPKDDVRFAIEFSSAQALNEDIMKIFATLETLDTALGSPNAMFSEEYYELRQLREIYFNRLVGDVNYTSFFEFFRWLDESFDTIIEKLIPKKTNYLGFNMIVEGHVLERSRVPYGSGDIYLGENDRRNLKGSIFLRQLLANIRKF
tara:strand:- start:654 stop:4175 length:3522 start_codon:yes stop_codon:yes gene_type:complete